MISSHHKNQLLDAFDDLSDVVEQLVAINRLDLDLVIANKARLRITLFAVEAVVVSAGNNCYGVSHAVMAQVALQRWY